jgi:hypothetical protein
MRETVSPGQSNSGGIAETGALVRAITPNSLLAQSDGGVQNFRTI